MNQEDERILADYQAHQEKYKETDKEWEPFLEQQKQGFPSLNLEIATNAFCPKCQRFRTLIIERDTTSPVIKCKKCDVWIRITFTPMS